MMSVSRLLIELTKAIFSGLSSHLTASSEVSEIKDFRNESLEYPFMTADDVLFSSLYDKELW